MLQHGHLIPTQETHGQAEPAPMSEDESSPKQSLVPLLSENSEKEKSRMGNMVHTVSQR